MLEARDISVFELKRLADNYVIQGLPEQTGSLGSKVRQWLRRLRSGSSAELLALGLADVEKLSQAGRAKRSNAGRLAVETRQASNEKKTDLSLPSIGCFLSFAESEARRNKHRSSQKVKFEMFSPLT